MRSTPNTPKNPSATAGQYSSDVDLVPGIPPVPISVWRTPRTPDDRPGAVIGGRLAYRIIASYTAPGDQVIDLTDRHTLALDAVRGGRFHHAAYFTDDAKLYVAPTPTEMAEPFEEPNPGWFGDDLDGDGEPRPAVRRRTPGPGTAALIVATWPLHESSVGAELRRAWLLSAASKLLRPGGCLVLVTGHNPGSAVPPEDFNPVVNAASGVGLGYLQHIVAVVAEVTGDEFLYYLDEDTEGVVHLKVHADLMVFTQREGIRGGGADA